MSRAQVEQCYCMEGAKLHTSRSDKNPGREYFGCPKQEATGTRCTYFRWAGADIPRTPCVCGRPLLVLSGSKTGIQFVRCYDTANCGFVHFFNKGRWEPGWSASAEQQRRDTADGQARAEAANKRKRQQEEEGEAISGSNADIRTLMRPVQSLVDDMSATVLPTAAAAQRPLATNAADDSGKKALQVIVLELVQEVEVLKNTVKRLESNKRS